LRVKPGAIGSVGDTLFTMREWKPGRGAIFNSCLCHTPIQEWEIRTGTREGSV
jgi:hypothetical protein